MLQSATEIEGFTKLTFYRKRDTGDRFYDVEIKVSKPSYQIIQVYVQADQFYVFAVKYLLTDYKTNCRKLRWGGGGGFEYKKGDGAHRLA